MPDETEAVGLLAQMILTEARRGARVDASDVMARLADQDRGLLDRVAIAEGHAVVRAFPRKNMAGTYQIQAAIAAVHTDAPTAGTTDWDQIVALYDQLHALQPNDIVRLNRAIALAELRGASAG